MNTGNCNNRWYRQDMTRRKTSFSISLPSSKLTIPSSPWSLCSSMVEHRSAESEGLRVDSLWGLRVFFFVPRSWQDENIFLAIKIVIRVIIRVMEKNNFPAWCEIKNRLKKTIMDHRDKFRLQLIFSSLKINKKFSV